MLMASLWLSQGVEKISPECNLNFPMIMGSVLCTSSHPLGGRNEIAPCSRGEQFEFHPPLDCPEAITRLFCTHLGRLLQSSPALAMMGKDVWNAGFTEEPCSKNPEWSEGSHWSPAELPQSLQLKNYPQQLRFGPGLHPTFPVTSKTQGVGNILIHTDWYI